MKTKARKAALLLAALAILPAPFIGCGDDDSGPTGPTVRLRPLTVLISLVRGIDIMDGEAVVTGYGGTVRFPWARQSSSGATTVSVLEDRFSTWRFDVEGRLLVGPDTTGLGLLYTQSQPVDMLAIGDTLGVRLDFVVPRIDLVSSATTHRLTWQTDVPRAISYELLQIRPGHPDSVFTLTQADTVFSRASITDRRRYQVRSLLRDDRWSAYSFPVVLAP